MDQALAVTAWRLLAPSSLSRFGGVCQPRAKRWVSSLGGILLVLFVLGSAGWAAESDAVGQRAAEDFFERNVRPVLVTRCVSCHGERKQEGGLRVDSRESLIGGGDRGPALVPGDPVASLLWQAVERKDDLAMPPTGPIAAAELAALRSWIQDGAVWPVSLGNRSSDVRRPDPATHWAFQPLRQVEPPEVMPVPNLPSDWVRTPVDAFILQKLVEQKLQPAPRAERRTLLRRLSQSLIGLPPTPEEVEQFVNDPASDAYEKQVERLLESPQYGEHWGRFWLDLARYSDTKGYVYAREERFWTHAWTYRDWVVRAFNENLPYDRFLLLQLAADQIPDRRPDDLAAMGYLTLGRRFLGVRRDVIDDRIDVISRGTMGLTVSCARCHDHKYDPIPTADYYSLYGILDSCQEQQRVLAESPGDEAFRTELSKRQEKLSSRLAECIAESSQRARDRLADYLFAQAELHKYPADGFDQIFQKSDLLPAFVRHWEQYLRQSRLADDPIFSLWHAYAALSPEQFAAGEAVPIWKTFRMSLPAESGDASGGSAATVDPAGPLAGSDPQAARARLIAAFTTAPQSLREVCDIYGKVFKEVDQAWQAALAAASDAEQRPTQLPDPAAEALRRVLYDDSSPCRVPEGPISYCETFFDSGTVTELWKLQGEVDRWLINAPTPVPVALTLVDLQKPVEPRVFLRGNPLRLGDDVPRQFLQLLSGPTREPFQVGSGRGELAHAIASPHNPLTARVLVNRIWARHFDRGLVSTPSDFGLRADPPTHPELLDWLAAEFIREGWDIKQLHRWIVLSSTFQQSSLVDPADPQAIAARKMDPENRWLGRREPHRRTFEELRDAFLVATQRLDPQVGGKPVTILTAPFTPRRTLYGLVDRQYFPSTLRVFDFANPDLHIAERSETTVPQQALFFLNHPLVLQEARQLAALAKREMEPNVAITRMFQQVYQRDPQPEELDEARRWIDAEEQSVVKQPVSGKVADWHYGFGRYDEEQQKLVDFQPLPHFTGTAWQGGPALPDGKLGWVHLTATGGHPGNDRAHAAVRRWIAPADMLVTIESKLVHEPAVSDGIRGFIVSGRTGLLASATLQKNTANLSVDKREVQAGETIDFIVDLGSELNSDQFLWEITLRRDGPAAPDGAAAPDGPAVADNWNSRADFTPNTQSQLNPWEQLAQILLCSNEFLFVD